MVCDSMARCMPTEPSIAAIAYARDVCSVLSDYVCPLYAKHHGQGHLLGTGVPLRFAGASVVITASHVLNDSGDRCIYTLGDDDLLNLSGERRAFEHRKTSTIPTGVEPTIDVDLALIVLEPSEAAELSRRFSFTHYKDLAEAQFGDQTSLYVLVGYPFSKNKPTGASGNEVKTSALFCLSRQVGSVANSQETGKHSKVHFAFPASPKGTKDMTGTLSTQPKPQGMSGGGVWRIGLDGAVSTPLPRLVGIGIEYDRHNNRFICTRIQHVQPMVADLFA